MNKRAQTILLLSLFICVTLYAYIKHSLSDEVTLKDKKVVFKVQNEESLSSVSERLEESGIIRSALLLRLYLSWQRIDTKLSAGEFHFLSPISLKDVAWQIIKKPTKPLYVVTIPEGSDDAEVISFFTSKNNKLSREKFMNIIKEREASGYLFPDTYFLSGKESEEQIIEKLLVNFREKYGERYSSASGTPSTSEMLLDKDIKRHVVLASILEGEANTEHDMQVIAGILLKREKLGMRLQVDAAKETYNIKGLPETPINNPGLISLRAAQNPIETPYLYYITGKDGKMYYSKTFSEHKKNIALHLK